MEKNIYNVCDYETHVLYRASCNFMVKNKTAGPQKKQHMTKTRKDNKEIGLDFPEVLFFVLNTFQGTQ